MLTFGVYTATLNGVGGGTGIGLITNYEYWEIGHDNDWSITFFPKLHRTEAAVDSRLGRTRRLTRSSFGSGFVPGWA
ncbi:MAG TPA: hypothetical protein VGQ40_05245, partial [Chthoniobacterales bacterium]|nr:hypothetical protein [Chthoniobacterales bacterium]